MLLIINSLEEHILSVQFSSVSQLCLTVCDPMDRRTPGFPVHHRLPELVQTHVHWACDAVQPSHPLSSPSPSFSLSRIRVFSNESALRIRWPNYCSFSFSTSPSNEYSGLISFRMVWLELFAVQGTLKSLLQHHSSKATILQCSALFAVQLSHVSLPVIWSPFISLKNNLPKLLCFSWFLLVAYSSVNSTFVTMAYIHRDLRIL